METLLLQGRKPLSPDSRQGEPPHLEFRRHRFRPQCKGNRLNQSRGLHDQTPSKFSSAAANGPYSTSATARRAGSESLSASRRIRRKPSNILVRSVSFAPLAACRREGG